MFDLSYSYFLTQHPMVRRRRPHLRRQKRFMDLLWPFLLIILIGIIVVLVVQFAWSIVDQRQTDLKNKIYLYMHQGNSEILAWGQTEWAKAYHGQLVLEGDMLAMERESRGFLEFYKGSRVRLDAESRVEVDAIDTSGDMDEIRLDLKSGRVWLNVEEDYNDAVRFVVETDNLRVTSYGTVFEVGMTDRESVRVTEGEVMVEVIEDSSGREIVLEQLKVGVGQQVEVTANDVSLMASRQPVSLLEAISDDWKETDWYSWNAGEDETPTNFDPSGMIAVETDLGVTDDTEDIIPDEEPEEVLPEEEPEEEDVYDSVAPVVTITTPDVSPYTFTEDDDLPFSIRGTASENTAKVTVTSYDENGTASPYALQHYEAGSTEWRYGASYDYGNLREGRNLFTVVAENGSGVESESVEVIIEVVEGMLDRDESEADVPNEGEEELIEELTDESEGEETGGEISGTLSSPTVTTLNDEDLPADGIYTTDAEEVTVIGTVSENAEKVFVNSYELTQYEAGSTTWVYRARADFLNYNVGSNSYEVYFEDADGNVSASYTFEIYREAP